VASLDDVAQIASAMPEATEGTSHGRRSWFVRKKLFVWERPFTKADLRRFGDETPPAGPIIGLATEDLAEKEALLEAHPDAFFTIPHLDGYPAVLVQLRKVTKPRLRQAILDGWLAAAPPALAAEHLPALTRGRGRAGPR
jgi:hypothetical protein